jgi:hypothetical protein
MDPLIVSKRNKIKQLTEQITSRQSFTYYGVFLFFCSVALLTLVIIVSKLTTEEKESSQAEIIAHQWTEDGVAVCDATSAQTTVRLTTDAQGGAILTWKDERAGHGDIYAQRLNTTGEEQWTANGVVISDTVTEKSLPQIIPDGSGGAFLAWDDYITYGDVYAQRINSSGVSQWTEDGVAVCDAAERQDVRSIISDDAGGIIIAWDDNRTPPGNNTDVYAQRLNSSGAAQWTANGVQVTNLSGLEYHSRAVTDGAGGVIIAWDDNRAGNTDIYAQRLGSAAGTPQWTANGEVVCNEATAGQTTPLILSDGAGGAFIIWIDSRNGDKDIYAQHLNSSGAAQWTENGVVVCDATGDQSSDYEQDIISDGSGGMIVVWIDERSGNKDIYAQRLNSSGVAQWTEDGVVVSSATGDQDTPVMYPDGSGGAFITWADSRSGTLDIYAQHIDSNGDSLWTTNGEIVSDATDIQFEPSITTDGSGGVIIAWDDQRDYATTDDDIYAQRSSSLYQIADLTTNLDTEDNSGNNVEIGTPNGLNNSSVTLKLIDHENSLLISEVEVDMTSDRSWSSVTGDSDASLGKSVVVNLTSAPGTAATHTLYVPIPSGETSNSVIICPNATSLSEVTESCTGATTKTEADADTSKVTIDTQNYWKIEGLSSSGGLCVIEGDDGDGDGEDGDGEDGDGEEADRNGDNGGLPYYPPSNTSPTIIILEPNGIDDLAVEIFTIQWSDNDPDDNATISLYYDLNNEGTDGILIQSGIEENNEDDEYNWNISQLAIGFYYVYAIIDDSVNTPIVVYSTGPITKINPGCEIINNDTDEANDDTDCDGMPDDWEEDNDLDPLDPTDADDDPDSDDLTNREEYENDTDPHDADTDGDGIPDGWEVEHGLDPTDPTDANANPDRDGCTNYQEYINNTDPYTADCNLPLPETGEEEENFINKVFRLISNLGKFATTQINNLRNNRTLVDIIADIGAPIVMLPLLGELTAIGLSASPALSISPASLLPALLAYIKRKKKDFWGIVYDKQNKKPIPFAIVRLEGKGRVTTEVTDLGGRYNILIPAGTYTLTVNHSEYKGFNSKVEVKKDNTMSINTDIGLNPKDMGQIFQIAIMIRDSLNFLFDKIGYFLLLGGFVLSLLVWIIVPNIINLIILLLYFPITFIYYRSKTQYPSNWGRVIDSENRSPVEGAFVKIYKEISKGTRLLDTAITNFEGRYGFLLDKPGEYLMLVAATNYKFPSKENTLPTAFHESLIKVQIGKNKVFKENLFVDPTEGKIKPTSPFSA